MELFVNNIKIPVEGSLMLKFFNPLFNDLGSYSLPVSFNGKIPAVKKAFGYPDMIEAEIKNPIEGRIKTQILELIGSWGISEASNDNISAYFKPSSGDFYSQTKGVNLNDLSYGGVKLPAGTWSEHLTSKMDTSYPESDYAAYSAYMPNANGSPGSVYPPAFKFVNPLIWDVDGNPEISGNLPYINYSVYLFAGAIIDHLFSEFGYLVEKNILRDDEDLKHLTVFNTYNIFDPAQAPYFGIVRIDYKNLVPHISCGDFMKALRDKFNVGFFINETRRSVRIVTFDTILLSGVKTIMRHTSKSPSVENNRIEGMTFPLNAPDAWVTHSFKSEDLTGAIIVSKFRDILPSTRDEGDIILVQSEPAYYKIKFTEPAIYEAERLCPDQFPHIAGDGTKNIAQLSGIPAMYTYTRGVQYYYLIDEVSTLGETEIDMIVPRCDLVGNGWGQLFTEFPLMFLFSRGIADAYVVPAEGVGVYKYPIGTSDVYDATGIKLTAANLALKWGGTYGLISKYWTNRINWEMNIKKLVKTELLSDDIARLIDMDEIKPVGGSNYLVNSFELELSNKRIKLGNVELFRV